jgi:hypothetical protein
MKAMKLNEEGAGIPALSPANRARDSSTREIFVTNAGAESLSLYKGTHLSNFGRSTRSIAGLEFTQ